MDLDDQIAQHLKELDCRPPVDTDQAAALYSLAVTSNERFLETDDIVDLNESITLHHSALDLRPAGHPDRHRSLDHLARCLCQRYRKQATLSDLQEAIMLGRAALELRPMGHPNRSYTLNNLALYLSDRYDKQASIADLDEAITLGRATLELCPPGHPIRAVVLYNLGNDLRRRFLKLGANDDLEEAISLHRLALDLRPAGHSDGISSLNRLICCLSTQFEELEADEDLDELITLHRAILDPNLPGHHSCARSIDQLLLRLRKWYQKLGMMADLDGCITLERVAVSMHEHGEPGHLVADPHTAHRKVESASDIQKSSVYATSLPNLVTYVKDMIEQQYVSGDAGEVVAYACPALRFCPPGQSIHLISLTALATCLRLRFQQHGAVTDLDEAIVLYQEVLEHCPSRSPERAPPLHELAWCLSQRFIKLSSVTDLDDAIKFEQAASTLYPLGHPDRVESLARFITYRQLKIKWRGANLLLGRSPGLTSDPMVKQRISNVVFEVLKAFPPRLLHTRNGTLCDRNAQILHFENSQEYEQLVSSASALDTLSQATHIQAVVSTYFRYVTLSHRWGIFEPLLPNIERQDIYGLGPTSALWKLQSFCLVSYRHGFLWAWSDTCCIDKESSAEVQEAIGSMFSWYRQSALTMVHLADISDTSPLTSSEWFKRGWTLQELLAPRALLFFTRDWSLYGDRSLNHKRDSAILDELTRVTGIASQHLTCFNPDMDDARSRLQWASTRYTTRPEDVAYSLLGVFGLRIPILYGESGENALGRLLAEVISKSGDTLILDFVGQSSSFNSCFPATVALYQIPPCQLPPLDLTTPPGMQNVRKFFILRSVRKWHQALSNLPPVQFINFRLFLPCMVYRVKSIVLTRVDTSTAAYVHRIQAMGLEPVEIALSQTLENISGDAVPYVLIRPWHSQLHDASIMTNDDSAHRWLARMQQPFTALLLKGQPQNEYRRVASFCRILARPTNCTGILKGEVTTLTVV